MQDKDDGMIVHILILAFAFSLCIALIMLNMSDWGI